MDLPQNRSRGRALGPELRAGHCILGTRLHNGRRRRGPCADNSTVACGSGGAGDPGWVPFRDASVSCSGNACQLGPMDADRHSASSDGNQALQVGLLALGSEPRGLHPARRVPLSVLPVQREHVHCDRPRVRCSTSWRVPEVRRIRMDGHWICIGRGGSSRCVAGCASKVLRAGLAGPTIGGVPTKRSWP